MDQELLETLSRVTEEEQKILSGQGVDQELYTKAGDFVVESEKMLRDGRLIDIRPSTRFIRFPRHRHNYVEIIYMCSGKTVHLINDTKEVVLEAGSLLFLNQHSVHEICPAGIGDVAVNFIVLPEFFDVALGMIDSGSAIGSFLISTLCQNENEGQYLHFRVADVRPVQNLVENLLWSVSGDRFNSNRINETTMGLLLLQLMNCTDRLDRGDISQVDNRLILRCLEYIEENYRYATLSELSCLTNRSVFRLSRLIKAGTGENFKQLLLRRRLNRAAALLTTTSLSVSDIIADVGYSNTSYFFRSFRERFGRSPSGYRRLNRRAIG